MRTVALGDVVDSVGGGTPPKSRADFFGGPIPWVTPKDMKTPEISDSQIRITESGLANSSARLVPAGSVLVVVRSGVLKHTLPVALTTAPVTINQDMRAFLPGPEVDSRYLAHLLRAKEPVVLRWVRATTADNFPFSRLLDLRVPLPTIDEQRRIARVLDVADSMRAQRRRGIDLIGQLAQSLFAQRFERTSAAARLSDLVTEFRYGTSTKSGPTGLPVLRIPNVVKGLIDPAEVKTVNVPEAEFARLRLEPGDVLFVRSNGNPDYIGRSAVFVPEAMASAGYAGDQCVFASYLIRARLNRKRIHPVFLTEYLRSPRGRRVLRRRCQTSAGQYNINIEALGSLKVPVAPLVEQDAFAKDVREIAAIEMRQRRHLRHLDVLFAALQHRAFAGVL